MFPQKMVIERKKKEIDIFLPLVNLVPRLKQFFEHLSYVDDV